MSILYLSPATAILVVDCCQFGPSWIFIAIFSGTSNGVLHAGDLLAQHLVVIGDYVCLYPLKFAIFGEVGETNTRKYLKEKFNLFQSVEEVSYDSATLLIAL